jgi:hypothetical protein
MFLERKMTPFIALNKIGNILSDPVLEDGLGDVFIALEVKQRIYDLHMETGLSVNQIFPVKSYTYEKDREMDVEKLALLCLQEVIQANCDIDDEEDEGCDFEYDD